MDASALSSFRQYGITNREQYNNPKFEEGSLVHLGGGVDVQSHHLGSSPDDMNLGYCFSLYCSGLPVEFSIKNCKLESCTIFYGEHNFGKRS